MTLTDTHCHLQFRAYENDREQVILRCQEKGVVMNVVGTQKDTNWLALELAEKHENIYATVGLHPIHLFPTYVDEQESQFISREEDFNQAHFEQFVKSPKVIAIGEAGIDLFHIPKNMPFETVLAKQKEVFVKQLRFAWERKLPAVIHCRDAYLETIKVLQLEIGNWKLEILSGVVHCYSSNWQNAQKFLDMGLYLGFTGIITFPPLKTNPKPHFELLEAVRQCPLDKMLIETDAPYLAPQKYRGKKCEPWMVEEVVKKISEIKGISEEEVRKITLENAKRLFKRMTT